MGPTVLYYKKFIDTSFTKEFVEVTIVMECQQINEADPTHYKYESSLTGKDKVFSRKDGQWHERDTAGDRSLIAERTTVPLSDEAVAILSNLGRKTKGPVFTNAEGEKIVTAKTAWTGARRRADVVDLRWHDLRHTAASRMVAAGADISEVKDILRHENIATTSRYVHTSADRLR